MTDERTRQQLINRRTTLTAALGRAEQFIEKYEAERDQGQVKLRLENLDTVWMGLDDVQTQLEDLELTKEGMAQNLSFRSHYETRYFRTKATLQSYLPNVPSTSTIPQAPLSGLSGIKLPTISLPEFDGDYNQWLPFHDTFVALIHSNTEVHDIQKFHYLRAALKGEAAQLVESIGISSAIYNIAWQTLVSRYANDYLLRKRHLQALLDCPRMKKESAAALHSVVDEYERHTKTLRQLGEPIETWSTMLEHLLCLRLDEATLKAWEDFATTVENPDYSCLIEFLQRRIRVLESMSVNHQAQPSSNQQSIMFRRPPFHKTVSHAVAETTFRKCHCCDQHHPLFQCPRFEKMSVSDRLKVVNDQHLCHNCFRQDHLARNCQSKFSCRHCKRRHHSLIHPGYHLHDADQSPTTSRTVPSATYTPKPVIKQDTAINNRRSPTSMNAVTAQTINSSQTSSANVLLSTVVLMVVDCNGQEHPARALLDSGSQSNIISERLCQLLRLKRCKLNIPVYGVGESSSSVNHSVSASIRSRTSDFELNLAFLVMPRITIDLPVVSSPGEDWNVPKNLMLADPTFHKTGSIDMLLGAEHFFSYINLSSRIENANSPTLIKSVFGWIVTGRIQTPVNSLPVACHVSLSDPLNESLERFWRIEEVENPRNYSVEEQECETNYVSGVSRTVEGRYIVRLPRHVDFDHMLGNLNLLLSAVYIVSKIV
ncbi:uncharacterized protein LOC134204657 [Armigeres subalbatus]|uniref:uncharacterized protein LOC134204657 n=1 Tax=Armigeres subalbatus TaxID=124917 RepID=UPI002ED39BEE